MGDDDFQTIDEIASHVGPEGSVAAAREWLERISVDDLHGVWTRTDPNLRLVFAQAFLWANRTHPSVVGLDLDETAEALASLRFDHDLWPSFGATQLGEFHSVFDDFFSGGYGVASRPRPVGVDLEIVKFVKSDSDEMTWVTEPTLVEAHIFLLRWTRDGWMVAGQGVDSPPEPGWPPTPGHPTM